MVVVLQLGLFDDEDNAEADELENARWFLISFSLYIQVCFDVGHNIAFFIFYLLVIYWL